MTFSPLLAPAPMIFAALLALFALGRMLRPLNTAQQTKKWMMVATVALAICVATSGLFLTAERVSAKESPLPALTALRAGNGAILVDCTTRQHYLMGVDGPMRRIGTGGQTITGGEPFEQACR